MYSRWAGHQTVRNECCGTLPYQYNNRTISSSSSNGRNERYSSYMDSNGFNADDSATLRSGVNYSPSVINQSINQSRFLAWLK